MAWCDVVEPRTLRECRIALGESQAAFAAMLGVSPESYRTWDAGRRATPPHILARARALATHRDDHALLPLPVLALLIGVHVKTLRAAARNGRLPVTYDTRTTFRRLRARATLAAAPQFRRSYFGRQVRPADRLQPLSWASVPEDIRCTDSRASSRARREPGAIGHAGGRGAESRGLSSLSSHGIARVRALLDHTACPTAFPIVRTRFLGNIAVPRLDASPVQTVASLWGGQLPTFDTAAAAKELFDALMGLWNALATHQSESTPFRLTRIATQAPPSNTSQMTCGVCARSVSTSWKASSTACSVTRRPSSSPNGPTRHWRI